MTSEPPLDDSSVQSAAPNSNPRRSHEKTASSGAAGWTLAVLVFTVFCLLGVGYVALAPVSYKASAVVSFQPRNGDVSGRDLVALLAQRYPEVAGSIDSITSAAAKAQVTPAQLQKGLSAKVAPNTLNLLIDVSLPDAEQAKTAADAIYGRVLTEAAIDPNLQAVAVQTPTVGSAPSGAPKWLLYGAVIAISAVIAILLRAVIAARRPDSAALQG